MLCFPNLDALLQALSRGIVPAALSGAPARAGFLPDGRVCIRSGSSPSSETEAALRYQGAVSVEDDLTLLDRDVYCWHQLLPLRPDAAGLGRDAETVLFEVADPRAWPALARVFRRLGRPLPAFCWEGEELSGPLWLRAIGPAHTVLLVSPDGPGRRAFRERAPRVWVEAGWQQPLVEQVKAPPGRVFVIRAPGLWTVHDDLPFQQELSALPLPELPVAERERVRDGPPRQSRRPLPARLRLLPDPDDQPPEFWVIRDRPLEQLASLCGDLDDQQLARLEFAVVEQGGSRSAVLRIRPSRHTAPLLELPGDGYRSCLRLPNLFVPAHVGLQPALRRDALRQLLANDPDRIVWLTPLAQGEFSRNSVPATAFRPLAEYVDYAAGQEPRALRAWMPSGAFAFEGFVGKETAQPLAELRKSLATQTGSHSGVRDLLDQAWRWCRKKLRRKPRTFLQPAAPTRPRVDRVAEAVQVFLQPPTTAPLVEPAPTPEEQPRHVHLEKRFLDLHGPPDLPERLALWPELAAAYQGLSNWPEAAVCWLNALWESEGNDLWVWGWYRAEEQSARWTELERDLERVLAEPRPEAADIRALAGLVVFSARQTMPPPALSQRLGRVGACLEAHERLLPVRAVWLSWLALSRLAGGDVLSLARARDRLFERLLRRGLSHQLDLAGFLRGEGPGAGQRAQVIRDWLVQLPDLVSRAIDRLHGSEGWGEPLGADPTAGPAAQPSTGLLTERWLGKPPPYGRDAEPHFTRALCDLTIAWGLGRVGGASSAARIVQRAQEVLGRGDAVHRFLLDAYGQRITESVDRAIDVPPPLPRPAGLETMTIEMRYKIDYLLWQSRVLEPQETSGPAASATAAAGQPGALGAIRSLISLAEQGEQIDRLLSQSARSNGGTSDFAPTLAHALGRAQQADEHKARELLNLVEPTIRELSDEVMQVHVAVRGLSLAAQRGFAEHLQPLVGHLERLLEKQRSTESAEVFESLAELPLRGLRRLGLSDRIDRLLSRVGERILPAPWGSSTRPLAELLSAAGWRGLLHVAGGWFSAGQEPQALFVLDQVRYLLVHGRVPPHLLLEGRLPPKEQAALACAYATAVGQAPLKQALERLEQLFAELRRIHFKHTTNSHYSLAVLGVVEAVVRAVADDDFAVEARVRRWLDEDEYLVRRRIHRDLRTFMGQAGIQ